MYKTPCGTANPQTLKGRSCYTLSTRPLGRVTHIASMSAALSANVTLLSKLVQPFHTNEIHQHIDLHVTILGSFDVRLHEALKPGKPLKVKTHTVDSLCGQKVHKHSGFCQKLETPNLNCT